jgi:glyoxylase I family protein
MKSGGVRPSLAGLHHLGVSVTDLERSLRFYRDVVGADVLVDDATSVASPAFVGRAAILSLGGRVFDLYEHSRNGGERFDPAHTGLDHLALEARSPEELQLWAAWVDGCGVERSEIRDVAGGLGKMFDFVDPDGLQIEFIHLSIG